MTRLLRLKDLRARGIILSWPMLKRRVERDGFPPGRKTGANERTWTEEEVEAWINSRPTTGTVLKGVAKTRKGNPRKAAASTTQTTA